MLKIIVTGQFHHSNILWAINQNRYNIAKRNTERENICGTESQNTKFNFGY